MVARLPLTHSLVLAQFCRLIFPSVLLTGVLIGLRQYASVPLPTGLVAVLAIAIIIPFHLGMARFNLWRNQRKAAKLGAILPPRFPGKSFGNKDVLDLLNDAYFNGYLSDHLWEAFSDLGNTYDLYIMWDHDYCTTDANIIKTVLVSDFDNWVKGQRFDGFMRSVLGTGVFNSDGDMWKFHRSMTRPFFSRERIHHYEIFDRHADEAIIKIKERLYEGYAVNFHDLISRFTLDSATDFLFGRCVNSLHSIIPYPHPTSPQYQHLPLSEADKFAKAFLEAQDGISQRARLGWIWPWFELFRDRTATQMSVVDAFLQPILQDALQGAQKADSLNEVDKEVKDDVCLLDHLVKHTQDLTILHDEVLNIMLAGRDTTAGMLTVTVYFLSQYPEVFKRLRNEIMEQVGPTQRPTYDDIREMKYLRAVVNESIRLYPAVPWNMRYAVKDTLLPNSEPGGKPFFVPAGASVSYSVHCMHRRKDYWGPDAEEYDPDRFLDERVHKYLTANPFIFLPFNAGPRICLGQQFAYNEMSFFIIRLLQHFKSVTFDLDSQPPETHVPTHWANCPGRKGMDKLWIKSHLTVYPAGGLWVKFQEAAENQKDPDVSVQGH